MFCSQCGKENRNDRKFCSECGAKLHDYTKEKENLLMPEDVISANEDTNKNLQYNLKIACYVLLSIAIFLTFISFLIKGGAQIVIIVIAFIMYIIYFILAAVKNKKPKKIKKNKK